MYYKRDKNIAMITGRDGQEKEKKRMKGERNKSEETSKNCIFMV